MQKNKIEKAGTITVNTIIITMFNKNIYILLFFFLLPLPRLQGQEDNRFVVLNDVPSQRTF